MIEGNVGVKCRLTVRGVKDKFQDSDIYAGTTSRSGQRLANAVAAGVPEFMLSTFDVSQTSAKGMTFEELTALSGQDIRKVESDAPKADVGCLRELPGFRDLDLAEETLTMLKPIYGSREGPRAWRTDLHQVLIPWLSCRKFYAGPEFYCAYRKGEVINEDVCQRALEPIWEQHGTGNHRNTQAQAYIKGNLQCLIGVHVDDAKGAASRETAESLLKHFHDKVG